MRERGRGAIPLTSKSDKTEPKAPGPDDQEWSQSQGHHRHPKPKSSASGEAGASSSWVEADLHVEVQMAEGDQGEETHLISQMDTTKDPPSMEEPLPDPVEVEDSGPSLPKSEGWRVNFTTILKYFMQLHYPSITPVRIRQAIRVVLSWLEDRQEYWQPVREGDPIAFMKYLAQVVQEQTGLLLPALKKYTKWIKASSWHHAVVLKQEQLNLYPHLVGAEHPKPNVCSPSEDTMLSHRADYAATHRQVEEALVTLAKAQQNLHTSITIRKGDHGEITPLELPAPIQAAPSTSGGGGDAAQAQPTGSTENKRHKRSASGDPGRPGRSLNPFSLNPDDGERWAMVRILLNTAGSFGFTSCKDVAKSIHAWFPDLDMDACRRMANWVLVTIAQYHLMCTIWDPAVVSPVIPDEVLASLLPLEGYYRTQPPLGISPDLRIIEEARTLQFITWLHKTDMCQQYGQEAAESIHVEDHTMGPLLSLFLCPGMGLMTAEAVFTRVAVENYDNLSRCLRKARICLTEVDAKARRLTDEVKELEEERSKAIPAGDKKELRRKLKQELNQLRVDQNEARREMERYRATVTRCQDQLNSEPYLVRSRLVPSAAWGTRATKAECSEATGAQVTPAPAPTAAELLVAPNPRPGHRPVRSCRRRTSPSRELANVPQLDQQRMEVDGSDSPIRKEEEQLLLTGGLAEEDPSSGGPPELEAVPGAETEAEAEATDEGATGSETPSTGLASNLSNLVVTSP